MTETTAPDAALLWARKAFKLQATNADGPHIDAGDWDNIYVVRERAEAFRAGQAHADAGLLEALERIADPYTDRDGIECADIARAAIAAAKGADQWTLLSI